MFNEEKVEKHVAFCIPTTTMPYQCTLDSLAASVPFLNEAGWTHDLILEVGSSYISRARANLLRKALDAKATVIVFIDHDLSWNAYDLLTLVEAEGDVISGTYRFKEDPVEFMGVLYRDHRGELSFRKDGAVRALFIPAGFLKVTRQAVQLFIKNYPELIYGDLTAPHIDMFNHGAFEGDWYGEDYAFSRRWRALGGDIFILPSLNLVHHTTNDSFGGSFRQYLTNHEYR